MMIKRILVGICDPLYTVSVASYAVELATRFGAKVTAISVTDSKHLTEVGPVPIGAGSMSRELIEQRIANNETAVRQCFDILVRKLKDANVECSIIRDGGAPYAALVDASRYHDLMIFGLQGLFDHGVTDEPPHELVHLVESGVRPIVAASSDYHEVQRAVIAYSGSVESAKAMKSFALTALWPNAQLKVVHFGSDEGDGAKLLSEAQRYLQEHEFQVETELIDESSRDRLLQFANQWNADLIVLGNSGKSLLRRRVFGDIALRTIRESQLPLFLSQ